MVRSGLLDLKKLGLAKFLGGLLLLMLRIENKSWINLRRRIQITSNMNTIIQRNGFDEISSTIVMIAVGGGVSGLADSLLHVL